MATALDLSMKIVMDCDGIGGGGDEAFVDFGGGAVFIDLGGDVVANSNEFLVQLVTVMSGGNGIDEGGDDVVAADFGGGTCFSYR